MPSSHRIRVSPEAKSDIANILQYTLENWVEQQRDVYANLLDAKLNHIQNFPFTGPVRTFMTVSLRTVIAGDHVFYYRIERT